MNRLQVLASKEKQVTKVVQQTNSELQSELPRLQGQKDVLDKELNDVRRRAEGITNDLLEGAGEEGRALLLEKIETLGKRRKELQGALAALELEIGKVERVSVDSGLVVRALGKLEELLVESRPYEKRSILKLFVGRVELKPNELRIGLEPKPPDMSLCNQLQPQVFTGMPVRATKLVASCAHFSINPCCPALLCSKAGKPRASPGLVRNGVITGGQPAPPRNLKPTYPPSSDVQAGQRVAAMGISVTQ